MTSPPRLLIAAAHKSSGKTTVTVGLCAALHAAGDRVQPFKKGPDYIDPMWLGQAAQRPCYNLDPHLMDHSVVRRLFEDKARDADISLVEGNHGLYDGLDLQGSSSSAALAHLLELPVLLVIDVRGMTRGIAPLLLGYQAFDRRLQIAGVVLSRVGGSRHESKLRAAVEHYTDLRVLGAVAEEAALTLPERHLGLQPCAERGQVAQDIARLGQRIGEQVDLAAVRELARQARPLPPATPATTTAQRGTQPAAQAFSAPVQTFQTIQTALAAEPVQAAQTATAAAGPRLRIAIARDAAFAFYYPDDLEAFEQAGAELVPFDTLRDADLPEAVDGLFLGGGFPEQAMEALEANVALRTALRRRIQAGLPTYAECGGLMYLARSIRWKDRSAEMVGVIPADALMCPRPVGRGYVRLAATAAHPWVGEQGLAEGESLWAHEFHHSKLVGLPEGQCYAWRMQRGHGLDGTHDGLLMHRMLASYTHLRAAAGSHWVAHFLASVAEASAAAQATAAARGTAATSAAALATPSPSTLTVPLQTPTPALSLALAA